MTVTILQGDVRAVLATLPADHFDCCVTSPPYFGLRDYGVEGQIGLEPTLSGYLETMVGVCREVHRVLKPEGTFWLNIGDSYAANRGYQVEQTKGGPKHGPAQAAGGRTAKASDHGLKPKDLMMVPNRLAILLQEDGWYVRSEIIWNKPNPMPESVTDRPTSAHEKVWLLTKSERYFYDADAIREKESVPDWDNGSRVFGGKNKAGANAQHGERTTGRVAVARKRGLPPRHMQHETCDRSSLDEVPRGGGRNARNVWTIATRPFKEAHFATMAPDLAERCIKAGCPMGGNVLDPFGGAGTTGMIAQRNGRHATLIEINPEYIEIASARIDEDAMGPTSRAAARAARKGASAPGGLFEQADSA